MSNDIRMQSIGNPAQLAPAETRTGLEEDLSDNRNEYVEQLKHSIRSHIILMNGVSDQLCAYLLKLLDFMTDTDSERRDREVAALSYSIIEAAALFVSGTIDSYAEKFENENREFPDGVREASNNVLIEIGKNRGNRDKIGAKNSVLKAAATALNAFSAFSGIQYPQLVDINGIPL